MENFIINHKKDLLIFSRNIFIFFISLILLNKFKLINMNNNINKFINSNILIILIYFFLFLTIFFYIKKDKNYYKDIFEPYFKYLFLFLLIIITIGSLQFKFLTNLQRFLQFSSLIRLYQLQLVLLSVGFGFFTFYFNREKVEKEIEDEKTSEESAEKKRYIEFDKKFPRLNKIWGLRSIVRWMYKEGWWYSGLLIAIVVLGFVLRVWNIKSVYFGEDEFPSIYASKSFLSGNGFTLPSGTDYYRSIIPSLLMSLSIFIFGFNPLGTRFPSIIAGILTIILIYLIIKKFTNKDIALFSSIIFSLFIWEIIWSREARMYSLFQFFYLLVIFILISNLKHKKIISFFFSLLVIFTHQLGILILIPLAINFFYIKGKNISLPISIVMIILSLFIVKISLIYIPIINFLTKTSFLSSINLDTFYNSYFINFFINSYPLFLILSLIGLSKLSYLKKSKFKSNYFILYSFLMLPILCIILLLNWSESKYIYFLFPVIFILAILNLSFIFKKKYLFFILAFILIIQLPYLSQVDSKTINHSDIVEGYSSMPHLNYSSLDKIKLNDGDIVASTDIWSGFHYLGRNDILLRNPNSLMSYLYYTQDGQYYEIYTNSTLIFTLQEFKVITANTKKIYVLIDYRFNRNGIETSLKKFITDDCELFSTTGDFSVFVCE